MEEKEKFLKDLDRILNEAYNNGDYTVDRLVSGQSNPKLEYEHFLVSFLKQEGMIDFKTYGKGGETYEITTNGKLKLFSGYYAQEKLNERLLAASLFRERILIFWTALAGIGTIGLLLKELGVNIFCHCPC